LLIDVSVVDPCFEYRFAEAGESPEAYGVRAAQSLEDEVQRLGPETVIAFVAETVVGATAGAVPPVAGYLKRVREICDRHGILWIADEVMAGFGRAGRWFGCELGNEIPTGPGTWTSAGGAAAEPDLVVFAKGVNSGYVPLGGVIISADVVQTFAQRAFPGGLTYSGHPLACAAAVATIETMTSEGTVANADRLGREVLGPGLAEIADRRSIVGEVRGTGVFWALELVRDRATREPLVPYNAAGPANAPMATFAAACRRLGLLPFIHMSRTHAVPPANITDEEARYGIALLDEALSEVESTL